MRLYLIINVLYITMWSNFLFLFDTGCPVGKMNRGRKFMKSGFFNGHWQSTTVLIIL